MKQTPFKFTRLLVLASSLFVAATIVSCTTLKDRMPESPAKVVELARPYLKSSASALTVYTIKLQAGSGKQEYATLFRGTALALRTLSASEKPPTEAEFKALLYALDPDNKYADLWPSACMALTTLYAGFSEDFPENYQMAFECASLLADGIDAGLKASGQVASVLDSPARSFAKHPSVLEFFNIQQTLPCYA